jgi:hypothetical protein
MNQTTNQTPFPELTAAGDDTYDLTVFLHLTLDRYPGGVVAAAQTVSRDYVLEAGGSDRGWRLRVSPWSGSLEDGDTSGPPVVDLQGETSGTYPLSLLRALLSGGSA